MVCLDVTTQGCERWPLPYGSPTSLQCPYDILRFRVIKKEEGELLSVWIIHGEENNEGNLRSSTGGRNLVLSYELDSALFPTIANKTAGGSESRDPISKIIFH